MPFLPPNQQCQSTEGKTSVLLEWISTYWITLYRHSMGVFFGVPDFICRFKEQTCFLFIIPEWRGLAGTWFIEEINHFLTVSEVPVMFMVPVTCYCCHVHRVPYEWRPPPLSLVCGGHWECETSFGLFHVHSFHCLDRPRAGSRAVSK